MSNRDVKPFVLPDVRVCPSEKARDHMRTMCMALLVHAQQTVVVGGAKPHGTHVDPRAHGCTLMWTHNPTHLEVGVPEGDAVEGHAV